MNVKPPPRGNAETCTALKRREQKKKKLLTSKDFPCLKGASRCNREPNEDPSGELRKRMNDGASEQKCDARTQQSKQGEFMTNKGLISWIGDVFHEKFSPTPKTLIEVMNILLTT